MLVFNISGYCLRPVTNVTFFEFLSFAGPGSISQTICYVQVFYTGFWLSDIELNSAVLSTTTLGNRELAGSSLRATVGEALLVGLPFLHM